VKVRRSSVGEGRSGVVGRRGDGDDGSKGEFYRREKELG